MGISLLASGKESSLEITRADLLRRRALVEKQMRMLHSEIAGATRDLRGMELKLRHGR